MKKISQLTLLEKEFLFKTLRVSITHHSNAIEGSTLSFGETKALLENGVTANNKGLSEQLIIIGCAQAYDVIIREANDKTRILDSAFIKDIHQIIFANAYKIAPNFINKPIGAYRIDEARITGADITLSHPSKISQEIENLLFNFKSNAMNIENIAEFHAAFEAIHPFADGNGRTGRLLMAFQCIQNDMLPPLIKNECRKEYLDSLYEAQTQHKVATFALFLEKCQMESFKILSNDIEIHKELTNKHISTKSKITKPTLKR